MSVAEILGFITGAACVLLAVRENIWNWPVAIANNVFYFVVFWHSKLYADAILQIFYVVISIYGWWAWLRGGIHRTELPIARVSKTLAIGLVVATAAATAALYFALSRFTDSTVPLGDAVTTAISLTAQFMLGRKFIENWVWWIVADVIYIALYNYKGLYLTAILYAIFIAMCVAGYIRWQ